MKSSKSSGNATPAPTAALITLQKQLQVHLLPALLQLRAVRCAITTCVLALHHQNADADADVAYVLMRSAANPLDAEIERLETLFNALNGGAPTEPLS